jgi:hypothetical protein
VGAGAEVGSVRLRRLAPGWWWCGTSRGGRRGDGEGSFRVGAVLHVVFTSLLILVCVFMGWFSAFVVYRLYRGRNAG